MSLKIIVYEDLQYRQFLPLTFLRPAFVLRAGIFPLWQNARFHFRSAPAAFCCRNQVAPLLAEAIADIPVNIIKRDAENLLFLNGRIRDYGNLAELVKEAKASTRFMAADGTAAVLLSTASLDKLPELMTPEILAAELDADRDIVAVNPTTATLYNHLWEIMADIDKAVADDFARLDESFFGKDVEIEEGAWLVNKGKIILGQGVKVRPGALIDASHGPVYIASGTRVDPQAAVYGPTYIGPNSVVVAGKIEACSLGQVSRAGGEIEESVFHAYVNKYHAGFIGHSYVGPWVNFGAMTTNSDLKNNYSEIRSSVDGEMIGTGSIKVGSFIGDHTKFGIGTLLNTGINVGVCCNVFGGNLVTDKEISSFSWGGTGNYQTYQLDKALETARRTAGRRQIELSAREEELLSQVAAGTMTDEGALDL